MAVDSICTFTIAPRQYGSAADQGECPSRDEGLRRITPGRRQLCDFKSVVVEVFVGDVVRSRRPTMSVELIWTLAIAPTAAAIAAVYGFAKSWRENQKLQLEIEKLRAEKEARDSRVYLPTAIEIERYAKPSFAPFSIHPAVLATLVGAVLLSGTTLLLNRAGGALAGGAAAAPEEWKQLVIEQLQRDTRELQLLTGEISAATNRVGSDPDWAIVQFVAALNRIDLVLADLDETLTGFRGKRAIPREIAQVAVSLLGDILPNLERAHKDMSEELGHLRIGTKTPWDQPEREFASRITNLHVTLDVIRRAEQSPQR